jgi:hypothetical protein
MWHNFSFTYVFHDLSEDTFHCIKSLLAPGIGTHLLSQLFERQNRRALVQSWPEQKHEIRSEKQIKKQKDGGTSGRALNKASMRP